MRFNLLLLATAFAGGASAAALPVPTVAVQGSQIVSGVLEGNVETFKGIPFAEPPVADLRFKKPVKYSGTYSGLKANDYKGACMQINPAGLWTVLDNLVGLTTLLPGFAQTAIYDFAKGSVSMSEDCLYLNVFRPKGTKPTDKLPVMAWIYGGGFLIGSSGTYNGGKFIDESVAMGQPVVFVSINYRLGPFGFLGGSGPASEGNTNVGLHDQREGLKWIQDHIADFGGDPSKVMLFGESAGAMSVGHQLVAFGGDNTYNGKPLFTSAIMQSGGVLTANDVKSAAPQREYAKFVNAAGCGGQGSDAATMACLRSRPVSQLVQGFNSYGLEDLYGIVTQFLGYCPRPDGGILPDDTFTLVRQNKIAQVPFITGTNEDDGSIFGLLGLNITFSSQVKEWTKFMIPTASSATVDTVLQKYPQDITKGCPYRRGLLDAITLQYKRLASVFNDILFKGPSRFMLQNSNQKRWNFQSSAFHNILPVVGTFHASDVLFQYFLDIGPAKLYRRYWIAFANHGDPNQGSGLPNWKQYTTSGKEMLGIDLTGGSMITDNTREDAMNFLITQKEVRI